MILFLFTFIVFIFIVLCLSLRLFFNKKGISGTCANIETLGVKKECDCEEICDYRKKAIKKQKSIKIDRIL